VSPAVGLALFLAGTAPGAAAADLTDDAKAFVESMAARAVESLTDRSVPRGERIVRFRRLFDERFAVQAISKFVLGRHWNAATESERRQYVRLFEELIAVSYVDRFASYAGETLKVTRVVRDNGDRAVVHSEIARPNSETAIKVNWIVAAKDGALKVTDVAIEGLSMSITLRDEYDSIVRKNNGEVAGLLEAMREKVAQLREPLAERVPPR
jgi:phospholipid transport system substrate-binding protein